MTTAKPNARGFTLIELMIVVAIIGILVSIAVPTFLRFQCKAKQQEAVGMLKGLFLGEVAYSSENGTFLKITELTGFGGMDSTGVAGAKFYMHPLLFPTSAIIALSAGVSFTSGNAASSSIFCSIGLLLASISWMSVGMTLKTFGWERFQIDASWSSVRLCLMAMERNCSIFP